MPAMKQRPSRAVLPVLLGSLAAPAPAAVPTPAIEASGLRIELTAKPGAIVFFGARGGAQ